MKTGAFGRMVGACGLLVTVAAASGCAYVTAVPAPPGSNVRGIRIYDVKPILIVNGSSATIEMVPNYNRAYALRFGAFLAKNDFEANIENGFITKIHANMDSTEFIKFLSEIAKKLPEGLSAPGTKIPAGGTENRFQVFDFVFDDDGNLVALRPLISQPDLLHVQTTRMPPPVPGAKLIDQSNTIKTGPING